MGGGYTPNTPRLEVRFFGLDTANDLVSRRGHADLVVANNVLAHVPDINDFVAGFRGPRSPFLPDSDPFWAAVQEARSRRTRLVVCGS